mgnify:FL=1
MEGAEAAREAGLRLRFPVFRGIEARSDLGDMLVFGYYHDIPDGIPFPDLARVVHESGGLIFAAHPFRADGFNLRTSLGRWGLDLHLDWRSVGALMHLDGIEVANGANSMETNSSAGLLAHRMCLPGIGGSDAHGPGDVGRAVTRFNRPIESEEELVTELRKGAMEPFLMPAPWGCGALRERRTATWRS